jgi:hypothetical protein
MDFGNSIGGWQHAQTPGGFWQYCGNVTDPAGAAIPNAVLTVRDLDRVTYKAESPCRREPELSR